MARHPEVTEAEIINAGKSLSKKGKTPNPGAIRVELGDRGGLMRIKKVWHEHLERQELSTESEAELLYDYDSLPSELIETTDGLIEKVCNALKGVVSMTYAEMHQRSEVRYRSQENVFSEKLQYYKEYEADADHSLNKLEQEIEAMQAELNELADQNAKLLIENATKTGRLDELEKAKKPIRTQVKSKVNAQ